MAFLDDPALDAIRLRVFRERTSTLESEAQAVPRTDLIETVLRVRHRMLVAIDALPDAAYEPQPDDPEGNEVWSATQIISHICASQLRFTEHVGKLVDYTLEPETEDLKVEEPLSMVGAKGAIKTATLILRQTLRAIPQDDELTKTLETERFGTLSVKGWLLLAAVHEHDHVQQLRSLATV